MYYVAGLEFPIFEMIDKIISNLPPVLDLECVASLLGVLYTKQII